MPEPGSQNGHRGAVEWWRPEDLHRIDQCDQAEEADRLSESPVAPARPTACRRSKEKAGPTKTPTPA